MKQVQITGIVGNQYNTTDGLKTPIGNAQHRIGSFAWYDGDFLLGGEKSSSRSPYVPMDDRNIILAVSGGHALGYKVRRDSVNELEELERIVYNPKQGPFFVYNDSAICRVGYKDWIVNNKLEGATVTFIKKTLDGTSNTWSLNFNGMFIQLSMAHLDDNNVLRGILLMTDGVYSFIDNAITLISSLSLWTIDQYGHTQTYYQKAYYDSFLNSKVIFTREDSETTTNYYIETNDSKTLIHKDVGINADASIDYPYSFRIGVHADYYIELANDASLPYLYVTSVRFKSNDGNINTDLTSHFYYYPYEDIFWHIMPHLMIAKKYMLLAFEECFIMLDLNGNVTFFDESSAGKRLTTTTPMITKKIAKQLIGLIG